jgi:hypothetical protein
MDIAGYVYISVIMSIVLVGSVAVVASYCFCPPATKPQYDDDLFIEA